jgi:branched-chain amino acid transport system ATP-binding protein
LRQNLLVAVAAAQGRPSSAAPGRFEAADSPPGGQRAKRAWGPSLWRPFDAPAAQARAEQLMQRFALEADANRPVHELAGGVRKLADIALALARRPRLLLLDEPTSGVSADEKFPAMERVMDALTGEAATVVFIEHDMDIVSRFSERVIAFYSGRVIADGAPEDVLSQADVRRYITGELHAAARATEPARSP